MGDERQALCGTAGREWEGGQNPGPSFVLHRCSVTQLPHAFAGEEQERWVVPLLGTWKRPLGWLSEQGASSPIRTWEGSSSHWGQGVVAAGQPVLLLFVF